MRRNTARIGITSDIRKEREMAKAEAAFRRVAALGSLENLINHRDILRAGMKRELASTRTARKLADSVYQREILRPVNDLVEERIPWASAMRSYRKKQERNELRAEMILAVEARKPHLWFDFLAEYRERLGLPPRRLNPSQYIVQIEKTHNGRTRYEPVPSRGPWAQAHRRKHDAYGAMVDYVVDHLGYLPDEVIVDRKGTKYVRAYVDLGELNETELRVVVTPNRRK
jgi:hypothetical protein